MIMHLIYGPNNRTLNCHFLYINSDTSDGVLADVELDVSTTEENVLKIFRESGTSTDEEVKFEIWSPTTGRHLCTPCLVTAQNVFLSTT